MTLSIDFSSLLIAEEYLVFTLLHFSGKKDFYLFQIDIDKWFDFKNNCKPYWIVNIILFNCKFRYTTK